MSSPFARIDIALLASAILADDVFADDLLPPAIAEAAPSAKIQRETRTNREGDDNGER
ncbi:MAG TPA: hypothetical protein VKV05_14460 [Terriglobales bacterium]|jgi:hypothetical protein|nr:hypothetical protein [Terriglobales bacterium]